MSSIHFSKICISVSSLIFCSCWSFASCDLKSSSCFAYSASRSALFSIYSSSFYLYFSKRAFISLAFFSRIPLRSHMKSDSISINSRLYRSHMSTYCFLMFWISRSMSSPNLFNDFTYSSSLFFSDSLKISISLCFEASMASHSAFYCSISFANSSQSSQSSSSCHLSSIPMFFLYDVWTSF